MKRYIVTVVVMLFIGCGSSDTISKSTELDVKIKADRSELIDGQSVTLEADVIGQESGLNYIWSEGNTTLGSEKKLIKNNFSLGRHKITLKVNNGKKTVTAEKTITVSEFLLALRESKRNYAIEHGKTNYNIDENVILEATIKGSAKADTYTWKENNKTIATTSKLNQKFPVGSHKVIVEARVNNQIKSIGFDFNVSDWRNFQTQTLTNRKDTVLVDREKKLMWVNDANESKEACSAVHIPNIENAKQFSKSFCQSIEFAGYPKGSWRTPTTDELSNFIKETVKANILPAYYQPCNVLFAEKDGVSKIVATRYGVALDIDGSIEGVSAKLGEVINYRTNHGIRCVRDTN